MTSWYMWRTMSDMNYQRIIQQNSERATRELKEEWLKLQLRNFGVN